METVCILGAGLYGSYLAKALSERFPQVQIKLVDVGGSTIKNEEDAGLLSTVKEGTYTGNKEGRYFGLGGTSARWAGQLVFFSENDCPNDDRMKEIKEVNVRYKNRVLRRFFKRVPEMQEYEMKEGLFLKQCIWLKYSQRNFFSHFKIATLPNVQIIKNARVVRLNVQDQQLTSVTIKNGKKLEELKADRFYLTCGAFESIRLLGASGIYNLEQTTTGFCDRVSVKGFSIPSTKAKIFGMDFRQRIVNNSLLTSRIIGEVNGATFYMKAIFNGDFIILRQLKNIFSNKHTFSGKEFLRGLKQVFHVVPFGFSYLYHKKLYVYKNWDIYIDIELGKNNNKIRLSEETDQFGERGLDIYFKIPPLTFENLKTAKSIIRDVLIENNIPFREVDEAESFANIYDTLHPYNMYHSQKEYSFNKLFNPVNDLFVLHTGMLSRVGGVNPSGSLLCLIEKHIAEDLQSPVIALGSKAVTALS